MFNSVVNYVSLKMGHVQSTANSAECKKEAFNVSNQNSFNLKSNKSLKDFDFKKQMENPAYRALHTSNVFFSKEHKDTVHRMAEVADLMYDMSNLEEVSKLFPKGLIPLPTPADLKVHIPTGLHVQAFRHGNEILFAVRGTNLGKETSTSIANVVADAGIGRHKNNKDIKDSINATNSRITSLYGERVSSQLIGSFETILDNRIQGHSESDRAWEMVRNVSTNSTSGGSLGLRVGGIAGGALATIGVAAGLAALPIAGAFLGLSAFVGTMSGATIGAIKGCVQSVTVMDGYATTLAYVKALDDYMMALKNGKDKNSAPLIKADDTIFSIGHSLGGYLAALIGAVHADVIYALNGPGVEFDVDVKETFKNLGLNRPIKFNVIYNSYSMDTDFIGNFSTRSGGVNRLKLPIIFKEAIGSIPGCDYTNILSHHGIKLMKNIINNSSIMPMSMPRALQRSMIEFLHIIAIKVGLMSEKQKALLANRATLIEY